MGKYGEMKRAKDWVGKDVVTLHDLQNGFYKVPAGSRCLVTSVGGGLRLSGPPCLHCGVKVFIAKVPYNWVKVAPKRSPRVKTPPGNHPKSQDRSIRDCIEEEVRAGERRAKKYTSQR